MREKMIDGIRRVLEETNFKHILQASDHGYRGDINPYHMEGSVYVHTMLVVQEALRAGRYDLVPAAMFHDIGKPLAREEIDEKSKVRFWGHWNASAWLCLDYLDYFELDEAEKYRIMRIINNHHLVYDLIESKYSKKAKTHIVQKFSQSPELLKDIFAFSELDGAGRISPHCARSNNPELLEAQSEILDRIHEGQEALAPIQDTTAEVVVMMGIPRTGKSTIVNERYKDHTVICRDAIVMELGGSDNYNECWKNVNQQRVNIIHGARLKKAIENGENILIDETNLSTKTRKNKLSGFPANYQKKCEITLPGESKRIEYQSRTADKIIPTDVIRNMTLQFQLPYDHEFDVVNLNW